MPSLVVSLHELRRLRLRGDAIRVIMVTRPRSQRRMYQDHAACGK
jgi:hypothetical protein